MALPSAGTLTGNGNSLTLSNATDVAGKVSLDFTALGVASNFPVVFGRAYSSSLNPVTVILSAANLSAAQDMANVCVQGITSDGYTMFTICFNAKYNNIDIHEYFYHVFESQQNNATGSFAIATGTAATGSSVTQGTDMCGVIEMTPILLTTDVGCTLTYGRSYATAPIVLFTPKINPGAEDITRVWQGSSTTTTFTLDLATGCTANTHRYAYHVIETQGSNATFPAITKTFAATSVRTLCTDVAGNIQITTDVGGAAGSVTFPFASAASGYSGATSYTTAPIVVFSPTNKYAASLMLGCYVTVTTTGFTMHIPANSGPANGTINFAYHVIETQA